MEVIYISQGDLIAFNCYFIYCNKLVVELWCHFVGENLEES